jgi:hypothetical protein
LRIGIAERDVATRRIVRRKREQHLFSCAVIDARGLEQRPIRRVEECWQDFYGREIRREVDVCKRNCDDQRGNKERKDHPRAEKDVAPARFVEALTGESPFTPRPQDRDGGGHEDKYTGKRGCT